MKKFLLVVLVLMAVGVVASVVLALLRVAVCAMIVVAGVLALLILLGWLGYDRIRDKIKDDESRRRSDSGSGSTGTF